MRPRKAKPEEAHCSPAESEVYFRSVVIRTYYVSSPPHKMIKLQRLNGDTFMLNAFMIEQVESLPDTTITLTNGKKLVVKSSEKEVVSKITDYYRTIGLFGIDKEQVE